MIDIITTLKAEVYDHMAKVEFHQGQIALLNNKIREEFLKNSSTSSNMETNEEIKQSEVEIVEEAIEEVAQPEEIAE